MTTIIEAITNLPQEIIGTLSTKELNTLLYCWPAWARPEQLPPEGEWLTWLIMAGRGFGKTRTGAEYIRACVEAGDATRIALVGPTAADVRDIMVEGESGLLATAPPWNRPIYEPSKRRLTWPNGAMATTFSAEEPDRLRGPQHDLAWCDELSAWRYPEAWDNLQLGLRLGRPRQIVTLTPKPLRLIRNLIASPSTVVTRGTSFDNRANLSPVFYAQVISRYEGTRLGRQEIRGELLEDVPGALWWRSLFEDRRPIPPDMVRVVVGVDPAVTSGEDSDETGIVVAGKGTDGRYYVLADRSLRASPDRWATAAVRALHDFGGDRIIGEVNNGGEMIEHTLRTVEQDIPYRAVHASRGKHARAEPIAALYEQGKVTHCALLENLEDQLCTWTPDSGRSPDRLDALVWALTELSHGSLPNLRFF